MTTRTRRAPWRAARRMGEPAQRSSVPYDLATAAQLHGEGLACLVWRDEANSISVQFDGEDTPHHVALGARYEVGPCEHPRGDDYEETWRCPAIAAATKFRDLFLEPSSYETTKGLLSDARQAQAEGRSREQRRKAGIAYQLLLRDVDAYHPATLLLPEARILLGVTPERQEVAA